MVQRPAAIGSFMTLSGRTSDSTITCTDSSAHERPRDPNSGADTPPARPLTWPLDCLDPAHTAADPFFGVPLREAVDQAPTIGHQIHCGAGLRNPPPRRDGARRGTRT